MKTLLLLIIMVFVIDLSANNVKITGLTQSGNTLTFEVTWENSWRSGLEFHDAVWIFVKQAPNGNTIYSHANISSAMVDQGYQAQVTSDGVGFILRRSANGQGISNCQVQLDMSNLMGAYQDIKVMGIEMVYVPQGEFYAGDGTSERAYCVGNDESLPILITSESALTYGTTSSDYNLRGITVGSDLSASYPKGFDAFYTTKYLGTMEQYADFLNCLDRSQQDTLVNVSLVSLMSDADRFVMGSTDNYIKCAADIGTAQVHFYVDRNDNDIGSEGDDGLTNSCNNLRPYQVYAYLDWAGLRPHSGLEMEKVCRGPLYPVALETPWGSSTISTQGTVLHEGTDSMRFSNSYVDDGIIVDGLGYSTNARVGCNAQTSGGTRNTANATYYGAMDYGAHARIIKIRYDTDYTGTHGDGLLSVAGLENVANWPLEQHNSVMYVRPSDVNGSNATLSRNRAFTTTSANIVGVRKF